MPQTRNLIPILNRTTLIASGSDGVVKVVVNRFVQPESIKKGSFWPVFGDSARMSIPVFIPDNFPCPEPRVLQKPEISPQGDKVNIKWSGIELGKNAGVAIHADTWLGPPDMYHTDAGHRFGDIEVNGEYLVKRLGKGKVHLECKLSLQNIGDSPVKSVDFSIFFPRAHLNKQTGEEIPLIENFTINLKGFSDPEPMNLLMVDGLGRAAWGRRCVLKRDQLGPAEVISASLVVTGNSTDREVVVIPLISIVAQTPHRYWSSSEVEISPPCKVNYSDYTHFNLVVADSKLFRISKDKVSVESASQIVRETLQPD